MWLTETPWPPILICAAVAVVLLLAWAARKRGIYLVGVVGLIVLSGGIYIAEQMIVTKAEEVEQAVRDLAAAVQRGDVEKSLEYISVRQSTLRNLLRRGMQLVEIEDDLRLKDLSVTMKAQNSRGIAHFRANGTMRLRRGGISQRHTSRWELTWRREAGAWRVIEVRRLHPLTGEEMAPLSRR